MYEAALSAFFLPARVPVVLPHRVPRCTGLGNGSHCELEAARVGGGGIGPLTAQKEDLSDTRAANSACVQLLLLRSYDRP